MENHWIYYEELKKISVGKPLNILWRDKKDISCYIIKEKRYPKPLNILWRVKKLNILWYQLENHWIYYEELKKISVGKPLNILWRVKKDICWKTTEYIMKR